MPSLGLQKRIILIVALGLAAILAVFAYLAVTAVQQSKDAVLQERLALAETTAGQIDYLLSRTLNQMEQEADRLGETSSYTPENGGQQLSDTPRRLDSFTSLKLVDKEGMVVWTEPFSPQVFGANLSDMPHVRKVLRTGLPTIDQLAPPGTGKGPLVALSVPLRIKGVVVGALVGELGLQRVGLDTLPPPKLGATGRSELIDDAGYVIASSGGPSVSMVDHVVVLQAQLRDRQAGVTVHRLPSGAARPDHIVAYAPLAYLPWGIVVEQDQDVALALPQELQMQMLWSGLLALLVAGAVAWVGVRRLVKPLQVLTLAAQRMAAGDLDNPVDIRRGDEVGTLARSFEAMRAKLQASLGEIRRWNEELEERVEERTRELELRNRELSLINSLAETVNRSLDLEEVLAGALERVLTLTGTEAGSISIRERPSGLLSRRVHRSSGGVGWADPCSNPEECLCGQVALAGEPLVAGCASQVPGRERAICLRGGFESLAILPLRSKDQVQGVLFLASSKLDHFAFSEGSLLAAVSHQIGIAVENAQLYGEIQRREETRRQLLAKVISAQEEERKRIARELHDESAQALSGLIVTIQAAQDTLPEHLGKEKERLARAKAQAIQALVEMRQMILDLRPTALDDLGLVPAIRWYAETHLQPLGIHSSVEAVGARGRLPPEMETSLFRISQEAINNMARHSQAQRASIRLEVSQETVQCIVEDDGVGFDVAAYLVHRGADQGLGLLGVRERVSLLGGTLDIQSSKGKGTLLRVNIPLAGG